MYARNDCCLQSNHGYTLMKFTHDTPVFDICRCLKYNKSKSIADIVMATVGACNDNAADHFIVNAAIRYSKRN